MSNNRYRAALVALVGTDDPNELRFMRNALTAFKVDEPEMTGAIDVLLEEHHPDKAEVISNKEVESFYLYTNDDHGRCRGMDAIRTALTIFLKNR